jgi:hypothetical protein
MRNNEQSQSKRAKNRKEIKMRTRFSDQITSCLLTGVALLVLVPVLGASSNGSQGNPEVLPPNSSFRGHTYAEWSERWWLWALSLPVDQNPITTNGTAPCENGQTGNVWFLAGIGGPGLVGPPTTIRCAIPPGTALFFPIINAECSDLEQPPFFGNNTAERQECAQSWVDPAINMEVVIDGRAIHDLTPYRFKIGDFDFTVPDNNILCCNVPGGSEGKSFADGFYLLLHPLSAGSHTIRIVGATNGPAPPDTAFAIDTTYIIQVGK